MAFQPMPIDDICSPALVKGFIRCLEAEYKNNEGLILSEHDLQCLLYAKIREHLVKTHRMKLQTQDNRYASPLHTEISFLDKDDKLRIKPDITLLQPSCLTLGDLSDKLVRTKSFSLGGSAYIVELKFCKDLRGITKAFAKSVHEDCLKILDLHSWHGERVCGMVVVFSRTDKKSPDFIELMERYSNHSTVQMIYATSDFQPQSG
jgi:hypothetical protein